MASIILSQRVVSQWWCLAYAKGSGVFSGQRAIDLVSWSTEKDSRPFDRKTCTDLNQSTKSEFPCRSSRVG